jgi:hypothetical protein
MLLVIIKTFSISNFYLFVFAPTPSHTHTILLSNDYLSVWNDIQQIGTMMLWEAVNYITAYGEVYSIQFYVIKFVSDCWFYLVILFPPTLRLNMYIYNWILNIFECLCHNRLFYYNLYLHNINYKSIVSWALFI